MNLTVALRRLAAMSAALQLAACASADPQAGFASADPYEGFNREMHDFNLFLDTNLIRPAAQGYGFVMPATFKHMIGNGFNYLDLPVDFANYVLQGEVKPALRTLGRFTINTVVGAVGLLDPATEFGLPEEDTDFGITLAKHGVGEGAYLVLPFIGPSTTRDLAGRVVDLAFYPPTYVSYVGVTDSKALEVLSIPLNAVEVVDLRDRNFALIDDLLYKSDDSYISLRSVYLQRRRAMIAGDEGGADALPDIFNSE